MNEQRRADLYRKARAEGKTYAQIAEEYGVSAQAIAAACGRSNPASFRCWTPERCIYPNLRKWLNDNRVSLSEFIRRMDLEVGGTTTGRFSEYFRGVCYPTKKVIDGMLRVTGLTYEQLWEVENQNV